MTKKERECLSLIRAHWIRWQYGPTVEELRRAMGLGSKSGVHRLIMGLERGGWIERVPHAARGIRPVDQRERKAIASAITALRRGDPERALSALEAAA